MFTTLQNLEIENLTAVKTLGICVTCNDVSFCVNRSHHNKPVWYCNEYNDHYKTNGAGNLKKDSFFKIRENTEDNSSEFKGICINCEKRFNCEFMNKEMGVWHCNEYS